jgi:hypothetical protein
MKIGDTIVFDLESWPDGSHLITEEVEAEILDFIHDPLKRHESKCLVIVDSKSYGIPFSQIKKIL